MPKCPVSEQLLCPLKGTRRDLSTGIGINNLEVPFSLAFIIQEGILVGFVINNLEVPFRLAFIIQEEILIYHYFVLGTLQREMKLD